MPAFTVKVYVGEGIVRDVEIEGCEYDWNYVVIECDKYGEPLDDEN